MLECVQLSRSHRAPNGRVEALREVNLTIAAGEFVCVRGPSGCGKTTLLLALGGMLRPSGGTVRLNGRDLYALSTAERSAARALEIGFVFQMFHLVPYLNILENVLLASPVAGRAETRAKARGMLEELGLGHRLTHTPAALSAGERQRTAIARALLNGPKVVLADEPTGNLDPENALEVLRHLKAFQRGGGTVVLVTHGGAGDNFADRVVQMKNGQLEVLQRP